MLFKVYSDVQERYRQEGLSSDIKQARLGIILLMAPLVFYIFNDYYFFGISPEFFGLAALRFGFLIFTVLILGYFNRLNNFRLYDRSIFLWGFVGVVITTLINASRPQNFLFHVIIVLSMIAITYFVIPQKHINRTIIASGLTLGLIVNLFTGLQTIAISALISIFVSLALVNLVGFFISRQTESYRFSTFVSNEENSDLARLASENPDIIVRVSKDNTILYSNPAAKQQFGEDISIGQSLPSYLKADFIPHKNVEVNHNNKTYLFSATPSEARGYINLFGRDITERKKDEELLALHEVRLKSLLELNTMLDASEKELVDFALNAALKVTFSDFAFVGLLSKDESVMTIFSWSKEAWLIVQYLISLFIILLLKLDYGLSLFVNVNQFLLMITQLLFQISLVCLKGIFRLSVLWVFQFLSKTK